MPTKVWTTAEFAAEGGGAEKTLPEWADDIAAGGGGAIDIDALPAAAAVAGADLFHGSQGGTDKKVSATQIATFTGSAGGSGLNLAGMAAATLLMLTSAVAAPSFYVQLDGVHHSVEGSVIKNFVLRGELDSVTPREYGAIADGASHPLSELYGTLGAAQAVYPFVTALTQQIDWAASKAAANAAFGGDTELITAYVNVSSGSAANTIIDTTQNWTVNEHAGRTAFRKFDSNQFVDTQIILSNTATTLTLIAGLPSGEVGSTNDYAIGYGENGTKSHLNKILYMSGGNYVFDNDPLLIRNLASGKIIGGGKLVTTIRGNLRPLAFDGIWYTYIADMAVLCTDAAGICALDMDGRSTRDPAWQPYTTRGVQGNILQNMLLDGGGADYAFAMCRQGTGSGQGSECSYISLHLSNAVFALYYQIGGNALSNNFYGGNFQNYSKHGAYVNGGTISMYGTAFQSTTGYTQLLNGGYDIYIGEFGSFASCAFDMCRSESLRFLYNAGAVGAHIRGCKGNIAMSGWFADVVYGTAGAFGKAVAEGGRLFVATTEGTSHATVEPDWASVATGGTIADNTIVWTETPFNVIENHNGTYDKETTNFNAGDIRGQAVGDPYLIYDAPDGYLITVEDIIFVDCTDGPKNLFLPTTASPDQKHTVQIIRSDKTANLLTITTSGISIWPSGTTTTIPGGSIGRKTLTTGKVLGDGQDFWFTTEEGNDVEGTVIDVTAATRTLLEGESGATFTNDGATARVDLTLPPITNAAKKMRFSFYVADTDGVRVIPNTGDTITVQGTGTSGVGVLGRIDCATLDGYITFVNMGATKWVTEARETATWAVT